MRPSPLFRRLEVGARRTPEKVALIFRKPEGGEVWTYRDLFTTVEKRAAWLAQRGLRPGDRFALYLGNGSDLVLGLLAALRVGAAVLPLNPAYRRRELEHVLGDAEPRMVLVEGSTRGELTSALESGATSAKEVLEAGAWGPGGTPEPLEGDADASLDDLALLLYTSGTTGRSKGAMLSQRNLLATIDGLLEAWRWSERDVLTLALPLFHTHGLVVGLATALAAGATVFVHWHFDAEAVLAELGSGEPTLFFGVPTLYVRLLEALEGRREPPNLAGMRLFCSGSAPLAPETHARFWELTGHVILERYGMTETGMNLSHPYEGPRLPGSVGRPLPGVTTRIVDEEDRELPAGEVGELQVQGDNVFGGYWRDPEKTASSFVEVGGMRFFRTGDLAREDPATGYVELLGRRHELVISGGFNVYPREVEEVLLAFPGVLEAAVVGLPDPEWGERVAAFLVTEDDLDEEGLEAHCRRELAPFKVPRRWQRLERLPRNAMGKVQKHPLRERFASTEARER